MQPPTNSLTLTRKKHYGSLDTYLIPDIFSFLTFQEGISSDLIEQVRVIGGQSIRCFQSRIEVTVI